MDDSESGPSGTTLPIPSKTCDICQKPGGDLVQQPQAALLEKFIQSVTSRTLYGDQQGITLMGRLGDATGDVLMKNQVTWHRDCYKYVRHKVHIEHLKNRYEEALRVGEALMQGTKGRPLARTHVTSPPDEDSGSLIRYTRSQSKPYDKNTCFFCVGKSEKGQLHQISAFNAGESS